MPTLRFSMENPPQNLRYGENLQRFSLRVRPSEVNAATSAHVQVDLYDSSTFIERLLDTDVGASPQVLSSQWSAESLIDRTGRGVEILITADADLASFVWEPKMILATASSRTVLVPSLVRTEVRTETRTTRTATAPSSRERTVNIPRRV